MSVIWINVLIARYLFSWQKLDLSLVHVSTGRVEIKVRNGKVEGQKQLLSNH